ncbi:MAG: putative Ig domain-containing protein [Pirellulaceae bacterium]
MAKDAENTDAIQAMIELRILSGSSRGQCHYASTEGISVGDGQACDVRLPSDNPVSNECRKVRIQYSNTGWSLRNLGTSLVAVNQTIVVDEARLKSRDVIRLSLVGPELMFSIVTDRSCLPSANTAVTKRGQPANEGAPCLPVDACSDNFAAVPRMARVSWPSEGRHRSVSRAWVKGYSVAAITVLALLLLVFGVVLTTGHSSAMSLKPIPEQLVDEGRQWRLDISGYVTPSLPDAYDFRSAIAFPDGMELNETTGQLSWTPSELQGPGSYLVEIEVRPRDASTAETFSFTILVRDVNTPPRLLPMSDTTFALGTKEALEMQVVAVDDDLPRQQIEFRLGANSPTGMFVDRYTGLVRWVPTLEHAGQIVPVEILANDAETARLPQRLSFRVTVLEPAAETPVESAVTAAVYLLILEEPSSGTLFPFAVAFAVRDDLLLTSGAVVQELAKARDRGMTILALHCLSQNHEEITALYLKPEYLSLQDRPGEQIYHDLGAVQLTVGKRPAAPLAVATASTSLEQGTPLRCVMPLFEAEPLTRFDNVAPTYHNAKIFMVTRSDDPTSSPAVSCRLLSLVGALPKNAYGSPIVNEQGEVVAVYVEKADLSEDKSLANLADRYHYALYLDSLAGLLDVSPPAWPLFTKEASEDSTHESR